MIDLLWLLLPVAAASGWLAARYKKTTKNFLSPDYFKGLDYLLNEEPDKAIDVFIKFIDVDCDTAETHFALGTFFRRRGEINRAIRIHENLIAKHTLHSQQRNIAMFELAIDYRQAGLLDRAENLLQELAVSDSHQLLALHQLLEIYQQVQDWEGAINTAQHLVKTANEPMHNLIAQYYCEQADSYKQQGKNETALETIQLALKNDPNCVRASLLEAQLALDSGNQKQAISAFRRVEQQDPDYFTEVTEPLQACYEQIGQPDEFTQYLRHILEHYNAPMLTLTKVVKQQEADFVIQKIKKQSPSVYGIELLLDLTLPKTEGIVHDRLLLLKDMTMQLLKKKPAYQCTRCGFTTKMLCWRCPSCHQWNTVKPFQ